MLHAHCRSSTVSCCILIFIVTVTYTVGLHYRIRQNACIQQGPCVYFLLTELVPTRIWLTQQTPYYGKVPHLFDSSDTQIITSSTTPVEWHTTQITIMHYSGLVEKPSIQESQTLYQMRVSSMRSLLPSKPTQAFKKASRALRCLLRLLMTSVPGFTRGALSM